jgi:hypothetical protein
MVVSVPLWRILPEFAPYVNLFLHHSPFQGGEFIENEVERRKKNFFSALTSGHFLLNNKLSSEGRWGR